MVPDPVGRSKRGETCLALFAFEGCRVAELQSSRVDDSQDGLQRGVFWQPCHRVTLHPCNLMYAN